ncbi:MAG TPA: DUF4112 domain-containing protein [Sphingomonas sp.]|jgi:hypothetical protein
MIQPTRMTPAALSALPIGRDPASVRTRVEMMERLLERAFTVPGINRPVGLDTIVGFVPVVGDAITTALGAWIVWEARNLGMSKLTLARMSANVGMDFALGLVPLVGDVADYFFRSNTRNLRLIKRHLDKHHPATVTIAG